MIKSADQTIKIDPKSMPKNVKINESNMIINSQTKQKDHFKTKKVPDHLEPTWNLDEINTFTRDLFRRGC